MSSSGKYIAVGAGSDFYLFDRENSSSPLLKYPVVYESSIVAISSDGKYAVAGAMPNVSQQNTESKLYVFERGQSQPSWTKTLLGVLESLSLSSNGDYFVASTSLPGVMYLFAREQETPLWSYYFGERSGGVKISDDGEYVVATGGNQSDDYGLRIFLFYRQNSTHRYVKVIPELPSRWGVSVSRNGSIFAISYADRKRLVLWDMNVRPYSSRSIRDVSLSASGISTSMSIGGRYVFVGTLDGIFVYEYLNNELALKNQYTVNSSIFYDVACSSDGKYAVAVGKSGLSSNEHYRVYFFEMENQVGSWTWLNSIIIGAIVVIVVGVASFIFYRSYRRVGTRTF
jgi:WD40 repeat protein